MKKQPIRFMKMITAHHFLFDMVSRATNLDHILFYLWAYKNCYPKSTCLQIKKNKKNLK